MTIRFAAWAKLWGYYLNRQAGPAAADNFSPLATYTSYIVCLHARWSQNLLEVALNYVLIVTLIEWSILNFVFIIWYMDSTRDFLEFQEFKFKNNLTPF